MMPDWCHIDKDPKTPWLLFSVISRFLFWPGNWWIVVTNFDDYSWKILQVNRWTAFGRQVHQSDELMDSTLSDLDHSQFGIHRNFFWILLIREPFNACWLWCIGLFGGSARRFCWILARSSGRDCILENSGTYESLFHKNTEKKKVWYNYVVYSYTPVN